MKIAYFLDSTDVLGGAGNVLLEQAKLMNEFHDVMVIIPCNEKKELNQEYLQRCQKAHVKYTSLAYTTAFNIQYIDYVKAVDASYEIKKFAVQEQVDFFHSVQLNIGAELAARELKIPHLMNIYQLRKEEFVLTCLDIFPRYHSCDSWLYGNIWKKYLGIKTCCIRPSAPLSYIQKKMRRKRSNLKILMLGSFEKRKNQMTAIQAVEKCNNSGLSIELTIAGSDHTQFAQECKDYVEEKGLYPKIHIIGFQSDIVLLLKENDGFLCASTDESFPSSIVEAMTYGLTIISTPVAGVPELLKDRINAYISKGYETDDIVECIVRWAADYNNPVIENIHKQAELVWKENFSPDIVRKKLDSYYAYILEDYQKCPEKMSNSLISDQDIRMTQQLLKQNGIKEPDILSRIYYYTCLTVLLHSGDAYIWGAGKYGKFAKQIIEVLFPKIKVKAYIDSMKTGEYCGIPVFRPDQVKMESVSYIFIGFGNGRKAVIDYLDKMGFVYNKDVWILP